MIIKRWLATAILAPIIVGFILLKAEYSFFNKNSDVVKSLEEKAKQVISQIESKSISENSTLELNSNDLQALFEVAQKIYGSSDRNAEYIKIIQLALAEDKPVFAFKVAQNIYGSTERNEQYAKIIEKSLRLKYYSFAIKVAENVYGSTDRNVQYRKIIEAGIRLRDYTVPPKK